MKQNVVDYTALHFSHEVVLRVELLVQRLAVLDPPRHATVCEIGLGSGDTTKMLCEHFDDVTCVDLEWDRLIEVSKYIGVAEPVRFACGDAATFDFDCRFDHIFLMGLLEHCPDGEAVLRNARRHLKSTGRVHVLVNDANSIHRHLGVAIGDIADVRELSPSDVRFGHHRVYTANALYAEVTRAGLVVDMVDRHYLKPLPSRMMDALPVEISRAFVELGRKFPHLAAYTYLEAVLP